MQGPSSDDLRGQNFCPEPDTEAIVASETEGPTSLSIYRMEPPTYMRQFKEGVVGKELGEWG